MEYRRLRSAHEHTNTPSPANKRQRINPSKPRLAIERLEPPPQKQLHPKRAPPKVSNVYGMCAKCNVHLCEAHFQVYHTENMKVVMMKMR